MKKNTERIYRGKKLSIYHQNIPKKQLRKHRHPEAHLFIPLEGDITITIDEIQYPVPVGQMIYIKSEVEHSFSAERETGERIVLQFNENNEKGKNINEKVVILPQNSFLKDLCLAHFPYQYSNFIQSLEELVIQVIYHGLTDQIRCGANLLFVTMEKILGSNDPQFKKIIICMKSNLEMSVAEIAKDSSVSARNLSRIIRSEVGLSPKDLYTYFRVQKACKLIYQGHMGLTQIAFECGYGSLSQFILNFKKWTGVKPSKFYPSH